MIVKERLLLTVSNSVNNAVNNVVSNVVNNINIGKICKTNKN